MSDPDKQIVRDPNDARANLAIGEPYFLHRWLSPFIAGYGGEDPMPTYPQHTGHPRLLEALYAAYPGKRVVVTNGAKQALLAALYALKKKYGFNELAHRFPHWPTYPTLASLSSMRFTTHLFDLTHKPTCLVMTSPNNPDSWTAPADGVCHIWDAAYAHRVYGWDGKAPVHEISVWSTAKLMGLSGLRVGWLLTEDEVLAEAAADYVEKTTSGVNTDAQLRVAATLDKMQADPQPLYQAYGHARVDLLKNASICGKLLKPHARLIEGVPANHKGMFAWLQAWDTERFDAALKTAGVAVVEGRACGANEPGWYRISLGQTTAVLEPALTKLAEALK